MNASTTPPRLASKFANPLLLLGGAALVLIVLGYAVVIWGPVNGGPSLLAEQILLPTTVEIYPKPLDRLLFLSLAFAVPVVLAGTIALAIRLDGNFDDPRPVFWALIAAILTTLIVKNAFSELSRLFGGWQWLPTLACMVLACMALAIPQRSQDKAKTIALFLAIAAAVLIIAPERIWTLSSAVYYGPFTSHYEAVTSAVIRIAGGGTCLVDVIPQYGCLGEFVAPLLKITGSSILAVTSIFVVLLLTPLSLVMIFSKRILTSPIAVIGCLLSLLVAVGLNLIYDNLDPILQYFPVRFVFPSLSLMLVIWLQRDPNVMRSFLAGLLSGSALCWNLESGVAVTGALAFFIAIGDFTSRPWERPSWLSGVLKRAVAFIVAVSCFVALFLAYLSLKSSSSPDLAKYFLFQTVFYITGFGMLPIPPFPDYWTIHIALIFVTLMLAAFWVSSKNRTRDLRLELATYVAIMATGLLLYYSGRSHVLVLRLVVWPGIILFFFLLDRMFGSAKGTIERLLVGSVAALSCALPAAFLLKAAPAVAHLGMVARSAAPTENTFVREDIAFIATHAAKGEPVAIIGLNQGVLYGEAGVGAALEGPGVAEMIRRIDRDDQVRALVERGPDKVFIGLNTEKASEAGLLGTNIAIDLTQLQPKYALAAKGPGGRLLLLRRKPFDGPDLFTTVPKD